MSQMTDVSKMTVSISSVNPTAVGPSAAEADASDLRARTAVATSSAPTATHGRTAVLNSSNPTAAQGRTAAPTSSAPAATHGRSHAHRHSRGKSLSRRGKHPTGPEFANRHQTNKMVKELSHVISCFRHLSLGLGSCSDGCQLRSDITGLRLLISHLIKVIRATLEAHTRKWVLYKESDRKELVRISNIYYSCVITFTQDMRRSLELYAIFVITESVPKGLINTGVSRYHGLMLSEREPAQVENSSASIIVQIQNCVKDMEAIGEEVRTFPWHTLTWSPSHATNGIAHDSISIEEDQALVFPRLVTSRWFMLTLVGIIVVTMLAVLAYTVFLYFS